MEDAPNDALAWLMRWYATRCHGDWEQDHGVEITLDNPGWSVKIDLKDTPLEARSFAAVSFNLDSDRTPSDRWHCCKVEGLRFVAAGGVYDLAVILRIFRDWAETRDGPTPKVTLPIAGEASFAPLAREEAPPSPAKLALIREFLKLTGKQAQIDNASWLKRHAAPGGVLWPTAPVTQSLREELDMCSAAIDQAYAPRRPIYQQEYEDHLNFEFTEGELAEIVAFLRQPAGQHYLDGQWRMNAYVGSNTEDLDEATLDEAIAAVSTIRASQQERPD